MQFLYWYSIRFDDTLREFKYLLMADFCFWRIIHSPIIQVDNMMYCNCFSSFRQEFIAYVKEGVRPPVRSTGHISCFSSPDWWHWCPSASCSKARGLDEFLSDLFFSCLVFSSDVWNVHNVPKLLLCDWKKGFHLCSHSTGARNLCVLGGKSM